jgi:hypothetical protein
MGTPSYEGKQVYMGLDVHREFFVASTWDKIFIPGVMKEKRNGTFSK